MAHDIEYSDKYCDDDFEYRCAVGGRARRTPLPALHRAAAAPRPARPNASRALTRMRARAVRTRQMPVAVARHRHVILPKHVSKQVPKGKLLAENEWRGLGVQQSRGWVHYCIHKCAAPRRPAPRPDPPACAPARTARSRARARAPPAQARAAHPPLQATQGHRPADGPRQRQADRPVDGPRRLLGFG